MLANTEGIVLHMIKYGDSSVIATIYTREFGKQSYILNAARSKKSKNKAGLLQPMFIVDLVTYQKQNREIQRIKEIKIHQTYQNIPFDLTKTAQAIFLAEVLYKTINEEESYPEMFDFIKHSLLYFDLLEIGSANFHLYFLYRLTEYLGFLPVTTKAGFENWFDLKKGEVVAYEPPHPMYINKEATEIFIQLANLKIQNLDSFRVSKNMRTYLLSKIIEFYELHFENFGAIKSLTVLKEVFEK